MFLTWPWLEANGKPELKLLKPHNMAVAYGQGKAIIQFTILNLFNLLNLLNSAGFDRPRPGPSQPHLANLVSELNKFNEHFS